MRSLRTRLIAILLIALVPAVLLFVWYAAAQRSAAEERSREDQVRRVELRRQTVEQMFVDVRSELSAVAVAGDVQRGDWRATERMLRRIAGDEPAYALMGAADASGVVRASSTTRTATASVADREWFRRVLRTGRPAVGTFEKDPMTGRDSVPVAVPIGDHGGAAVLFASVPVSVVSQNLAEVSAPAGAVLVLVDSRGEVIARIPALRGRQPGAREPAEIVKVALARASGEVLARGLDGVVRRYEYRSVPVDPSAPLHVIVGYDESVVFAPERRQLATGLGILGVVALVEIALAYAGASRWVLRPVERLNEATAAVAAGDLSARVGGELAASEEFRSLGAQFDAMAASLQERLRELRESQALLNEERERLRATIDYLPVGVALLGPDNAVLELNPANERIWEGGPKPRNLDEYRDYKVFDARTGERVEAADLPGPQAVAGREPVLGRLYAFERFDGTRGSMQISAIPFFNDAGELLGAVVTTEDVTTRVRRQALSDALNRIDAVVHSSLDVDAIMQRSLDAGAEALGIDVGTIELRESGRWTVRYEHGLGPEDVGRSLSEEEAPNAAEMARTREPLTIPDMAGTARDRGFVHEHGERALLGAPLIVRDEVMGCLLFYEGEPREFTPVEMDFVRRLAASVSLALDNATLYDELEDRVQRRTAELEAANKELEAFSYSVSHDLRAPLRSIDGFSRALEEDYADRLDPDATDYLERIRAGANKMGDLIDALLTLSRLTRAEMRFQTVDLSQMAEEVAGELRQHEPDRCVELVVTPGLQAKGDPALLRVLLTNLVGNAWKFTSASECGRIEVGRTSVDGERAFFVRDNGVGFDMAYASKLFSAFQRLHAQGEYPGIGIGLTIAARVVHRHGGRIWAEAEPGKGATFYFTLS